MRLSRAAGATAIGAAANAIGAAVAGPTGAHAAGSASSVIAYKFVTARAPG